MTFDEIINAGKQILGAVTQSGEQHDPEWEQRKEQYDRMRRAGVIIDEYGPQETHTDTPPPRTPPRRGDVGPYGIVVKDGVWERLSPLGYLEYVVSKEHANDPLYGIGKSIGVARRNHWETHLPYAIYSEEGVAEPGPTADKNLTHERIHMGQMRLPNHPDIESVAMDILPPYYSSLESVRRSMAGYEDGRMHATEPPAYAFERRVPEYDYGFDLYFDRQNQQEAFNRYIDAIHRLNPGQSYHVEAPMPDELIRNYVTSHPRPAVLKPQVEMQERSLADTIRSAGRGR